MNAKEAEKVKFAMKIIRNVCEHAWNCEGCPFEKICYAYSCGGKRPWSWKEVLNER